MNRKMRPLWHLGIVMFCKERRKPSGEKYSCICLYNISYNLGNIFRSVEEYFAKE